ncbi:MAG: hypothetical protein WCW66_05870 [Patescibacteria group bacterium]|jgi:hypothetical protein
MKIMNLTPHAMVIFDSTGATEVAHVEASGKVARVLTETTEAGVVSIDGVEIPVVKTSYGQVENLPEVEEGTTFVVSILVIGALRALGINRGDVVSPDTGPQSVVRDGEGKILGVKRFTR